MNKDLALKDDKERAAKLLECEQVIMNAGRRGLEATRDIGTQLQIIDEEKLYLDRGCKSLNEYAEIYLKIDRFMVARILNITLRTELLEQNNLRLPSNESQLLALKNVPDDKLPETWQRILDEEDRIDRPLTAKTIRTEVQKVVPPKQRGGVKTPLEEEPEAEAGGNGQVTKAAEAKARISLSEKGEAALERIRRLAGDAYANAIEDMTVPISERDLCKWADQEDWMLKKLGYYLVDQRWSLSQALKYEAQAVSAQTTVHELIIMAKFSQTPGELDIRFQDARILVNIEN
jgi:hypothetical protein